MRKRIGVLLGQLEENTQKRFMEAFMREAYDHDYDICIFSMYQKYQETELRNIGDPNIFSLIQFESFDGLIILLDTILTPNLSDKLLLRIKEAFFGPVIVVDRETDLFDYVLMDHYTPITQIMNHLIEVHGYKDIAFLGGKEGHPHSVQRLNGYLDSMKAHGLQVRNDRIWHGNFWFDSGKEYARHLLANPNDFPEAVMCANDYMAIGFAAEITAHGYKIPEHIALAGYDSNIEGRTAPTPLTSADIPAAHCGRICLRKLHEAISGETEQPLAMEADLVIGGSCGCQKFTPLYTKSNRDEWKTDHSEKSYYSDFNHITEDMLCQTQYEKFFGILATYSYQIRPFTNFWICLNANFADPISFIGDNARRHGYDDLMHMVIKVGETLPEDDPNAVDLTRVFDRRLMLPELYQERSYPTTFIFTPMFFEDRCFGYAVLNYGTNISVYNEIYRVWMRNVNQGVEAFYRQKALSQLIEQIKSDQIRDKQTGLYNYQGFRQKMLEEIENNKGSKKSVAIIAIDIEDLKGINETYSRIGGDSAIAAVSLAIERVTHDDEFCGRLSNDEFLIGFVSDDCEKRYQKMSAHVPPDGISFYDSAKTKHHAFIHYEMRQMPLDANPDIDFLINRTVNAKNHSKKLLMQQNARADLSAELRAKCDRVAKILDAEDFIYHFQPIVRATDGTIYAYEALMRHEGEVRISPLEIIECAQYLNRLYDVQRITFMHVLNRVEETPDDFAGKKVFINSLPAFRLRGKDRQEASAKLNAHRGQIVVEYTESSEFTDEELRRQEEDNAAMQIEVALDDYGSGYSNANNLIRYSPQYVKIDRQLISGINENAQKRHFVESIISYANQNNIKTLAEGVETMEELRTVILLGVDLIQGYYTGYPAKEPVAEIDEMVSAQIRRFYSNKDRVF